ncbi:hypothetical protein TRFO_30554 [Tritrichomonas foetus]|uniref:Uncharacterized protein n=1 Tax=Tritrichomonas foetus TaxID=1144522 RepID=A0A1J4JUH6_9EUKA|nr:hypothetical protein TRFO_30554 [Tritrichomonas foetus]|eukprot:OHT02362.1 hypothetical protein TRFO_30554 [Tritrichomonas foetus]
MSKTSLSTPRYRFNPHGSFRATKTVQVKSVKKGSKTPKSARKTLTRRHFGDSSSFNSSFNYVDADEEAEDIEYEFNQLKHEIAALQCEVKPLRQTYLRLQNDILMHHRALTALDEEIFTDSDALNAAVTAGDFSSAIVQFQNESDSLSHQLNTVKQLFSQNSLRILRQEVEDGENFCASLTSSVYDTDREIHKNVTQYETYKLSRMYEDVQMQKEKIYNLTAQLDEAMQLHAKLKSEHHLLSDTTHESSSFLDEATTITKLNRKLSAQRRKHFEQCELLITLRNKQLKEIESVGNAMHMKQHSSASLTTLSQLQSLGGSENF